MEHTVLVEGDNIIWCGYTRAHAYFLESRSSGKNYDYTEKFHELTKIMKGSHPRTSLKVRHSFICDSLTNIL